MLIKKIFLVTIISVLLFTGCSTYNLTDGSISYKDNIYKSNKDVLMLILDGSGSMNEIDKSGKIKINAAKDMLRDISSQIDANKTNVGLISFNSGCKSTKLLLEPANNDLEKVINISSKINPSGKTPLAQSIKTAGETLKNIDKKINIIIISDGVETCGGDPVSEARKLKNDYGIKATIYVVGYSVDNETKSQLQRLAIAGGGKFYSAQDSIALDKIINNITDELKIKTKNWKGSTFKFKINFDSNSFYLKPKYDAQVKKVASYLKKTGYSAELQGHTDSTGSNNSNKILSQKRAQSVVNRLIKFGVNSNNVYAIGFGELAPISQNKTKKDRFENRRVEAHIIKNGKMDISYINKANTKNKLQISDANTNSFIGYYKVLDKKRRYSVYHTWMELYGKNNGLFGEYINNKLITTKDTESFAWKYNKSKKTILLDFTNNNKRPGFAQFNGEVTGNTNDFKLSGHWGNGTSGVILMSRISQKELYCMKENKIFRNGICLK